MGWARRGATVFAAIGIASAVACSPPPEPDPGDGTELERALDELVERADGPVGVITVIDDGTDVTVRTAGQAAWGSGVEPSASDHVRIASLAKAMTGAVALSLVDQGVLALDDTVGEWRPDLPVAWHDRTLRQVLSHTSGIPDFGPKPGFGAAVGASPTVALPPSDIVAIAGADTDFEPAERYEYSNTNPFVTGLIIEAATGHSYAENLAEHVLEPLGMDDTYLPAPDDPTVAAPVMRGYDPLGDGTVDDVTDLIAFGGWAWASGGIVSTPADLTKFIQGYVGGDLFSSSLVTEQRRFVVPGDSHPKGPGSNGAGPALFRYQTPCGTVYGHSGSILGYTQFMVASSDGERSVTFTISSQYTEGLLPDLQAAEQLAICEALGG